MLGFDSIVVANTNTASTFQESLMTTFLGSLKIREFSRGRAWLVNASVDSIDIVDGQLSIVSRSSAHVRFPINIGLIDSVGINPAFPIFDSPLVNQFIEVYSGEDLTIQLTGSIGTETDYINLMIYYEDLPIKTKIISLEEAFRRKKSSLVCSFADWDAGNPIPLTAFGSAGTFPVFNELADYAVIYANKIAGTGSLITFTGECTGRLNFPLPVSLASIGVNSIYDQLNKSGVSFVPVINGLEMKNTLFQWTGQGSFALMSPNIFLHELKPIEKRNP